MNKNIIFLLCYVLLGSQNSVMEKTYAEVGIAAITENNNNNVVIDIFSINEIPIAGFQFEIIPNDLFLIDSISGGICDKLGFELHSNNKGLLLAFSMQGKEVPKSKNNNPEENILFSVYGKKNKDFYSQDITLGTTLASKMGKKVNAKIVAYKHVKARD